MFFSEPYYYFSLSLFLAIQIIMFECFVFWNHYVWMFLKIFEALYLKQDACAPCAPNMKNDSRGFSQLNYPSITSMPTHILTLYSEKKLNKEILQYFHRTRLEAKRFQYSKWFLLIMHRPTVSGHFRCSIQALKGNLKYSHVGFSAMEYRLQFSTVTLVTTVAFCCSFTGASFPDLKCHSCSVGDVRWKTDL